MTRVYWGLSVVLLVLSFVASAWLYSRLPDQIPTHWNIRGEVDGYGGKGTLFIFPAIMAGMLVLFAMLPVLSPKPFEVDSFQSTYLYIMLLTIGLFAYMDGVMLYVVDQSVSKGVTIDLGRPFIAGLFLFFALMGNVMGKVRRNFYIGIRVPWTLASDRVWNDTHRLAAWVMVVCGVIGFIAILLGAPIIVSIVVLLITTLIPVVYSFLHYKALERSGSL
jgi:uncharacterized membrane protein